MVDRANNFISQQVNMPGNLLITNNGKPISVFNRTYFSINSVFPLIDTDKFNTSMDQIDQQVTINPKNAIIDKNGIIIPEQVGYHLDRQVFTEKVFSFYFGNNSKELEVPLLPIYPEVDSELIGNIKAEKIGEYITFFNSNNKERNNNILLAAKAIDNYILFPGEIFSFNKVVGERTAGKGYLPATVIVNGEFSEDFGGGICQVSSTLFYAVEGFFGFFRRRDNFFHLHLFA